MLILRPSAGAVKRLEITQDFALLIRSNVEPLAVARKKMWNKIGLGTCDIRYSRRLN